MTPQPKNVLPVIAWDQAYNRTARKQDGGHLQRDVVNVIRTYVDNHTLRGWVKQETLAEATGLSLRAVKRQIKANCDAGWLRVTEKGHSGGRANTYELMIPEGVISDTLSLRVSSVTLSNGVTSDPLPSKGCHERPLKGVTSGPPTTPRTSPQRSSTPKNGVINDTIRQPAESSAGDDLPANAATESNGVINDTIWTGGAEPAPDPWAGTPFADNDPFADTPPRPEPTFVPSPIDWDDEPNF